MMYIVHDVNFSECSINTKSFISIKKDKQMEQLWQHACFSLHDRQFRSVVHILKMGEEQLLYHVLFWYMDYYAMS